MSDGWTIGGNARREEVFLRAYAGPGARRADVEPASARTPDDLAACLIHTLLRPDAGRDEVDGACRAALRHGFGAVCVNPRFVSFGAQKLQDSAVLLCSVVGFPLGASDTEIKALEARRCVQLGAAEVDMVIPIGALREGAPAAVFRDVAAVRRETMGLATLKVIVECGLLADPQKELACRIAVDAGADYVQTGTGFAGGDATLDDVRLLRDAVGPSVGVVAAGGIRDRITAEAMLAAGACRLATSHGTAILAP
ncbi:MAG: deoxyribose-phosphate aldolase [Candidatus Krumholzibacteriia bacterium]